MDATRRRFGSFVEWLFAAACAAGAFVAMSSAVQEFRSVRAVVPVSAATVGASALVEGVPPDVVSVPLLLLAGKREVRVGERLADVAAHLGSAAQLVSESFEDTAVGRRVTRFYNDLGVQFVIVFDAAGHNADPRVSAIFIR
jgi:hypothetical protein